MRLYGKRNWRIAFENLGLILADAVLQAVRTQRKKAVRFARRTGKGTLSELDMKVIVHCTGRPNS